MTTLVTSTSPDLFESIYADAHGDASRVPWADQHPHPALITWMNAVAPSLLRCGSRVCVVGCGLGDDAREIMSRGYDVTAFDCSKTAIEWARSLDPANARCYVQSDLFNPTPRWKHRFDLVVEVNTIHSLSPDQHAAAIKAISELVSAHGHLLVICRAADELASSEDGPPWALTEHELVDAAAEAGMTPMEGVTVFDDDETPPVRRMRALFKRA
jgi:SAM-dependent methyltransferase